MKTLILKIYFFLVFKNYYKVILSMIDLKYKSKYFFQNKLALAIHYTKRHFLEIQTFRFNTNIEDSNKMLLSLKTISKCIC